MSTGLAAVGIPTAEDPPHTDLYHLPTATNDELSREVGPDPAETSNTVIARLPYSEGNYRNPAMQSTWTVTPYDGLGRMRLNGLHGEVIPLAEVGPSAIGEPTFWELGYVVREVPPTSDSDLGVMR